MAKNINIVFFGNFKSIVWETETNSKLSSILEDLNMKLGKTVGQEIEISNNLQSVKTVEKPNFSTPIKDLELNIIDNRIDFKIEVKDKDITSEISKYFEYLEKIVSRLNLKVSRIGISYSEENNKKVNLTNHYLNLYPKKEVEEFGIKQNIVEEIEVENTSPQKINIFTVIETKGANSIFVVDINTIHEEQKELDKKIREKYLSKVLEEMEILINKIKGTIGG